MWQCNWMVWIHLQEYKFVWHELLRLIFWVFIPCNIVKWHIYEAHTASSSDWMEMSPQWCSSDVGEDSVPLLSTVLPLNLPPLPCLWFCLATLLINCLYNKTIPTPYHFFINMDPIPPTLKMQAARSSKTSVSTYSTWLCPKLTTICNGNGKKNVFINTYFHVIHVLFLKCNQMFERKKNLIPDIN